LPLTMATFCAQAELTANTAMARVEMTCLFMVFLG
jgi:hypothetical protein